MAIVVHQNLAPGDAGVGQGASVSYTPPVAFTPGRTIFILMTCFSTEGLATSVTVGGNAATRDRSNSFGTDQHLEIWRVSNLPSAGNVVINWAGPGVGNYVLRGILEVSGLENTGVVDQNPAPTGGTGTGPSITSGTTTQADELVVALMQLTNGDATITQPGSYTSIMNNGAWSTDAAGAGAYRIVSSTGTQTATWALSASVGWAAALVTYRGAAAPAADPPPLRRARVLWEYATPEAPPTRRRIPFVQASAPPGSPLLHRARIMVEVTTADLAPSRPRMPWGALGTLPADPDFPPLGVWLIPNEPVAIDERPRRRRMIIPSGPIAMLISTVSTAAATQNRTVSRSQSVTTTAAASSSRMVSRTAAVVVNATSTRSREVGLTRTVVSIATPTRVRSVELVRAAVGGGVGALSRVVALIRSVVSTSTPSADLDQEGSMSLSAVHTAFPSLVRVVSRALGATSTATPTRSRSVELARNTASTGTASRTRTVNRALNVTSTGSPSLSSEQEGGMTLNATHTAFPSLSRVVSRALGVVSTGSPSRTRVVSLSRTSVSTGNPSVSQSDGGALEMLITAVVSAAASVSRVVRRFSGRPTSEFASDDTDYRSKFT